MRNVFSKEEFDVIFDKFKRIEIFYGKSFLYIHGPQDFNGYKGYQIDNIVIEDVPFTLMVEFKNGNPWKLILSKNGILCLKEYINHAGTEGNEKVFMFDNISPRVVNNFKKMVEGLKDAVKKDHERRSILMGMKFQQNNSILKLKSLGISNDTRNPEAIYVYFQSYGNLSGRLNTDGSSVDGIKISKVPFDKFLKIVEFLKGE